MAKVTMVRTISTAREYLKSGNGGAYARLLSAAIRAAGDDCVSKAIIKAISEDKAERFFDGLGTSCPLAKSDQMLAASDMGMTPAEARALIYA